MNNWMRHLKETVSPPAPLPTLKLRSTARGTGPCLVIMAHAKTTPPKVKTYCMGK